MSITFTQHLTENFKEHSNTDIAWESQVATRPYAISDAELELSVARYVSIKSFHRKCLDLFRASLNGDADPQIAASIIGDVPDSLGQSYHMDLPEHLWQTPHFFRTDEAKLGALTEIQCSGSGWDLAQALFELYASYPDHFGAPQKITDSLAERVADALRELIGPEPIVHHLLDNASRPHGIRFFINKLRQQGIRYLHHDEGVKSDDCQFIRSHDFYSLPYHNFFERRVELSHEEKLFFDLPPIALFDTKMILAWPFWSVTRMHFDDDERGLFPFTTVVTSEGMEWEDGSTMAIKDFAGLSQSNRDYFLKYAGTDVGLNWGSKAVFSMHSQSGTRCLDALAGACVASTAGKPWILQKSVLKKEFVEVAGEPGETPQTVEAYGKWSNFYGPSGHLGQLVMHKNAHKVHGSSDTVMSIVY